MRQETQRLAQSDVSAYFACFSSNKRHRTWYKQTLARVRRLPHKRRRQRDRRDIEEARMA